MKFPAQIAILFAAALAVLPGLSGTLANGHLPRNRSTDSKASAAAGQIPAALPKGKN